MRILVLGADGYLGWPMAMSFKAGGHEVCLVDNYLRRRIASQTASEPLLLAPLLPERASFFEKLTGGSMQVAIGDCCDFEFLAHTVRSFAPDALVHFAEQPSAPYSMIGYSEARSTLSNNLMATFNVVWTVLQHAPDCHIIKLGTLGEYGTPNIDIEEGWIEIEHKGRRERFLFPRQSGSLYHTSKILDTDLLWFYVRVYGLRVTDLMQGPVYGLTTRETELHRQLLPHFYYDDIFGTVINRFLAQAVAGVPLTVYGSGSQTRGYLNIIDTMKCITLAASSPAQRGELRVLNQFTEIFTVNELAGRILRVGNTLGLNVRIKYLDNPRTESEHHYYNPQHNGLRKLGLQPQVLTDEILANMLETILPYRERIDIQLVNPRVRWPKIPRPCSGHL